MRCGRARHHTRLLRQGRTVGGVARRLRRFSGRVQGQQHRQGRPWVRPDRQGLQEGARRATGARAAVHRLLALQPLPRDRRVRQTWRLRERSGQRAPRCYLRRVRPGLHRCSADVRARAGLPQRWVKTQSARRHAQAAAGFRMGPRFRRAGEPGAGRARNRHPYLLPDLRRPVPRAGLARYYPPAPDWHGRSRRSCAPP